MWVYLLMGFVIGVLLIYSVGCTFAYMDAKGKLAERDKFIADAKAHAANLVKREEAGEKDIPIAPQPEEDWSAFEPVDTDL